MKVLDMFSNTFFRILLLLCIIYLLVGCDHPYSQEKTSEYPLPEGLKDCQIFKINATGEQLLHVVRCPGQETVANNYSVRSGKTTKQIRVITIDGVEYEAKQPPKKE